MDKVANEDHTHHITAEEISVYRNNWWLRSNTVGSDTIPVRHRADFKQAMSTLRQLKHQEDTAHQQRWKSDSSSWWNWQESWLHSSDEHHHEDGPSPDWSGKLVEKWLGYLFEVWFSEFTCCIKTVQNSVTANSSLLSPTGGVNTIHTSNTAKSYVKWPRWRQWLRYTALKTSVRRTTASSQTTTGTTRTTCSSPSTTPMTTLTHTSTDAWRTCTETARASLFHIWWWHRTPHERIHISICVVIHGAHSLIRFFFSTSSSSSCLSPFLFHLELFLELLYTKDMANLRRSATNESEDTSELLHLSLTRTNIICLTSKNDDVVDQFRKCLSLEFCDGATENLLARVRDT